MSAASQIGACSPTRSMQIGLVAYAALPSLVFVRVPSERGRWVLTDRAVVDADCPLCKAIAGEPCRRNWRREGAFKHGAGIHCMRRTAARKLHGYFYGTRVKPKLRLTPDDLIATEQDAPEGAAQ